MNIYGYTVDDVSGISDKLFTAQEKGVLTVGQLSGVLGESASTAKAYNVDLNNLLAGYVSLTKAGIGVEQSNTKMSALFEELGNTGSTVGQILQNEAGKSFTQLMDEGASLSDVMQILNNYVGESQDEFNALWSSSEAAGAGFIIASDGGKVFKEVLDEMGNSAGKCDEAFNQVAETSEYKFKQSIQRLKNSFTKLGESLLPVMDEVSEGIGKIADVISKLDPKLVANVAKFGALAIAIGGVGKVVGNFTSVLGGGMKILGNLMKVASDTKSLGSFAEALGNIGKKADGSTGGVSNLLGIIGKITPTGGAIGLAIGAVTALGVAFYNNQKDIEESEAKLNDMADCYDDFTGRIRTNESIWTEIFGNILPLTIAI